MKETSFHVFYVIRCLKWCHYALKFPDIRDIIEFLVSYFTNNSTMDKVAGKEPTIIVFPIVTIDVFSLFRWQL